MRLYDAQRQAIVSADEVGRGGEGVVYAVQGSADEVAKIYSQAPDLERVDKLDAMVELWHLSPQLGDWCAWPQSLLRDEAGVVRGFLMPRVHDHRPIHDLYSPEPRKQAFPNVAWDFLVRTAANCARMFATLHDAEVLVGDVNERNLLVGADATVRLVDCDSFQLARGPRLFRTGVGVVDYTPPELQGADFRQVTRTQNHDRFGLAVMLFKLLFMGRHPFSGGATGELAAAIRQHQFDYDELAARLRHLVPMATVSAQLLALFAAAFGPGGDVERPGPEAWLDALIDFEASLLPCPREPLHRAPPGGPTDCVWCDLESALGYAYFEPPRAAPYQSDWTSQLECLVALRATLASLDAPMDPSWYDMSPVVQDAVAAARRSLQAEAPPEVGSWYVRVLGGLATLAGTATLATGSKHSSTMMVGGVATWVFGAVLQRRRQRPWRLRMARLSQMAVELGRAEAEWKGEAYRFREHDRRLRAAFEQLATQYQGLDAWHAQELAHLQRDMPAAAAREALAAMTLESAVIPGISVDRRRALQVRGMASAADLERERLAGVPGLTTAHIDALVQWRQGLERQLIGRTRAPPTPVQRAGVDQNCRYVRENLELELRGLLADIREHTGAADDALLALYAHGDEIAVEALALGQSMWLESRGAP